MRYTQTIRCVRRSDSRLPYRRIASVGGANPDGSRWKQSQEQTIKEIENDVWEFYAQSGWRRDRVVVASYMGFKYIKGLGDELEPEALLALPECPQ
jgi:hypothetical protein